MASLFKRKKDAAAPPPAEAIAAPNDKKRLEDYEQSRPLQMTLFQYLQPQESQYSNTIELYDFMPKYHWGKVERIGGEFLRLLKREFVCRGEHYKIEIAPAVITDRDGVERYYYPSKREELVEDALRRIATTNQGVFLDEWAGVKFTLYQLQQELKRNGHSYSKDQIKDALQICNRTNITVTSKDGTTVLGSSMFDMVGLKTGEDWKGTGKKTKAFVRFNSLVSESIKSGAYRQLDYETAMSYANVVARQLHKRISHHYTFASLTQPYHLMLSTMIRDFGLAEYDRPSHNFRFVLKSLDEMKVKDVLLSYTVEKTTDLTNRNKLIDAKFTLTPHPSFINAIKKANIHAAKIRKDLDLEIKAPTGKNKSPQPVENYKQIGSSDSRKMSK